MINIYLADRNNLFRESLKFLIEKEGIATITIHRNNIDDLAQEIERNAPDIVLTEFVNGSESLAALKNIVARFVSAKFLILAHALSDSEYHQLIKCGVKGCVLKESEITELLLAIREVTAGKIFFQSDILKKMMTKHLVTKHKNNNLLTEREKEVLCLLCDGLSNEEISEKLHLSCDTIKWHRGNILLKSGCKNLLALYKYSVQNNLYKFHKQL